VPWARLSLITEEFGDREFNRGRRRGDPTRSSSAKVVKTRFIGRGWTLISSQSTSEVGRFIPTFGR